MTKIVKKNTLIQKSTMASRPYNLHTYISLTLYIKLYLESSIFIFFVAVCITLYTTIYGKQGEKNIN